MLALAVDHLQAGRRVSILAGPGAVGYLMERIKEMLCHNAIRVYRQRGDCVRIQGRIQEAAGGEVRIHGTNTLDEFDFFFGKLPGASPETIHLIDHDALYTYRRFRLGEPDFWLMFEAYTAFDRSLTLTIEDPHGQEKETNSAPHRDPRPRIEN